MKNIIIAMCMLIAVNASAQEKNDNTIILTFSNGTNLFDVFVPLLIKKGWETDQINKEYGFITTKPKDCNKNSAGCKITIVIDGTTATITGKAVTLLDDYDYEWDMQFKNARNNIARVAWNEAHKLVMISGYETISYEQR